MAGLRCATSRWERTGVVAELQLNAVPPFAYGKRHLLYTARIMLVLALLG